MNPHGEHRGTAPWEMPGASLHPENEYPSWTRSQYGDGISQDSTSNKAVLCKEILKPEGSLWGAIIVSSGSLFHPNKLHCYQTTGGAEFVIGHIPSDVLLESGNRPSSITQPPTPQLVHRIKSGLGLNLSQLARACGVQRPTIYEWLRGANPRRRNTERLFALARLAENDRIRKTPGFASALEAKSEDIPHSVMDLLSADALDIKAIEVRLNELASSLGAPMKMKKANLARKLRAAGYTELSETKSQDNLSSAADIDLGPDVD